MSAVQHAKGSPDEQTKAQCQIARPSSSQEDPAGEPEAQQARTQGNKRYACPAGPRRNKASDLDRSAAPAGRCNYRPPRQSDRLAATLRARRHQRRVEEKLGLTVTSEPIEKRGRVYRIVGRG